MSLSVVMSFHGLQEPQFDNPRDKFRFGLYILHSHVKIKKIHISL